MGNLISSQKHLSNIQISSAQIDLFDTWSQICSTPTWVWCLWALLLSLTWRAPPESVPRRTWRRGKSWDLAIAFSEREQAQPPPYQVFGSVCIRHRTPPNLDQGITASRHRSCYSCAGRCVWKTSAFVSGRELGWVTVPFNLHWRGPSAHCTLSRRRDQGPQRKRKHSDPPFFSALE